MIDYTIEKDVPIPTKGGEASTFEAEIVSILDKLVDVGTSAVFKLTVGRGYSLAGRVRAVCKIYSIITKRTFTSQLEPQIAVLRIWRTG